MEVGKVKFAKKCHQNYKSTIMKWKVNCKFGGSIRFDNNNEAFGSR